ncbi:OmpA family protein [Sphingobium sp. SA2]|uniref:OmpA family protein n=1 Tax=Sphingobium sp. SA2 TaxID=1524832 RepID=UPI0028C1D768|nr:OmpA family protein [Sphingobium sp. SA2]MDT7533676.1 OmpA family protein [Sphingobium sp. SA2]
MSKLAPTALLLCASLAACQPPAGQEAANNAIADNGVADNGADNMVEPQRSILRPEVVPTVEEPKIEPEELLIGFGALSLQLDDGAKAALDALMTTPAMQAGGTVALRGHSDSLGTDGDNRVASRRRAERVREYLVEKGVAAERITLVALGETRPIAPNAKEDGSDDPEGRAKNRRVEVRVTPPPVVIPPPVPVDAPDAEKP